MIIRNSIDRDAFIARCEQIDLSRWAWEFTAKPYKTKRSKEQNGYLWGVVYPTIRQHVFDSTGQRFTTEEIHEWCKAQFLDGAPKEIMGRNIIVRSTTKLNKQQFSDYIAAIQHHFAEQGCYIPEPEYL